MDDLLNKIRLEPFQSSAIIDAFKKSFLVDDHLWVFGSRVNMQAKGGDIDLYVETNAPNIDVAYAMKSKFIDILWDQIGEQKIDIVLNVLSLDSKRLAIFEVARNQGVKLL